MAVIEKTKPRVVIVGAGFGGLQAAQALAKASVEVVLIDRRNYHLFQPLLYQVATAAVAPGDIASPVRSILRSQENLEFRMADVQLVDFEQKSVRTNLGDVSYDYLIMAVGGITNYFGIESVAKHSFGLKDIDEAIAIRNHILYMFERASQEKDPIVRRGMLTFVAVGGGPTGVECAGALAELINMALLHDYPSLNVSEIRIVLIEATQRLLASMPENLGEATYETLRRKNVDVRLGVVVEHFDGERVTFKDGENLLTHTLIWAAGVQAAEVVKQLPVRRAAQGRVVVTPTLQLAEHSEVFFIGDAAFVEELPLPMIAPVAVQQAKTAVANILRLLGGQELKKFTYKDPGTMATVGRNFAVATMGNQQFKGFFAWILWLVIHLVRLIGFRNRLAVIISWGLDYWFAERIVRLIVPKEYNYCEPCPSVVSNKKE